MAWTFSANEVYSSTSGNLGKSVLAGEVINAGRFIYLDPEDGYRAKMAKCASTNPIEAGRVVGIALNSSLAVNQPIQYADSGIIHVENTPSSNQKGKTMVLGPTGKAKEPSDLNDGDWVTVVGHWLATGQTISLNIIVTDLQWEVF